MLSQYLEAAMRKANYEILANDGVYYGEIPECNGVYATADTLGTCRSELREVLEEWTLLRVHKNLQLPSLEGSR